MHGPGYKNNFFLYWTNSIVMKWKAKRAPLHILRLSVLLLVEGEALTYSGRSGKQRSVTLRFVYQFFLASHAWLSKTGWKTEGSSPSYSCCHLFIRVLLSSTVWKLYVTVSWVNDKILGQNVQELMNSHGRQHNPVFVVFLTPLFLIFPHSKGLSWGFSAI